MTDIAFNCTSCGQTLEGPQALAGTIVECPVCGTSIAVAALAPEPDPMLQPAAARSPAGIMTSIVDEQDPEATGDSCPECGAAMADGSVLCVECGFHTGLGKKISTDLS